MSSQRQPRMSSVSCCELQLCFAKKMLCRYYFYNPSGNSSTIIDYEYDKVSEMFHNNTLAKLLTPIQTISLLSIETPNKPASRQESNGVKHSADREAQIRNVDREAQTDEQDEYMSREAKRNGHVKPEIPRLIEYIINNISTPKLTIIINPTDNIELNLSQMQPCKHLQIYDCVGVLPKEYLHHMIKLLENGQTEMITFRYNRDMPLREDLDEFENIDVRIDPMVTYASMITYQIQLKK